MTLQSSGLQSLRLNTHNNSVLIVDSKSIDDIRIFEYLGSIASKYVMRMILEEG